MTLITLIFFASHSMNSSLDFKNCIPCKPATWFDILYCWRETGQVEIIDQFMLTFRVGPQGNFNDPFFLPSIVDCNIYIHPPLHKMNPLIITYTWGNTNTLCLLRMLLLILSVPCCIFATININ